MPRITSLNILLDGQEGKDYLAELYGKVIENVNKQLVSVHMKNTDLSGDPEAGSVEAKRFANAKSKEYGTARKSGKGDDLKAKPVTVSIDTDREIVEELAHKDVKLYGVDGVLDKRANNHIQRMASELDSAFYAVAVEAGTEFTPTEITIEDEVEEAIQVVENVKNDFVDGVPRSMINLVCSTKYYGKIRTYLDKVSRPNVDSTEEEFLAFHGVKTFSCVHLPDGVKYVVMVDGAVAQPVMSNEYKAEKIPLSEDVAVELFYHYGTKAVTPDLIFYAKFSGSQTELGTLTVTSAAGTNSGDTKITVDPSKADGNSYKYKVGNSATNVTYGQNVKTWSAWDGTADITAATGKTITVVECDAIYNALKAGSTTVTAQG